MSRNRRDHGRRTQRRHLHAVPDRPDRAEDQPLFQDLRRALRSDSPLDLLAVVSTMVAALDPRDRNPFTREEQQLTLDDLVDSLIGTSFAETTAALTVMRQLITDETTVARIDDALGLRRQPLPRWLSGLGDALVDGQVWTMTHILSDGDDYFVGATLPTGWAFSAVVYVDHNLSGAVKDGFLVPEPLSALLARAREAMHDLDQALDQVDPATARADIEQAIERGAMMYPPLESDTWPACRPLVEWIVRHLPPSGVATPFPEWSDAARGEIAAEFFGSPFAEGLDHPDQRDLLDSVLWFGSDYGPGDPLRWSPVRVELLLLDWFPRKIVAEPAFLAKLPTLLRAYIRYSHDRTSLRRSLTMEALAAVDRFEPEYQRLIRSTRPQGPAALLAGLALTDADPGQSLPDYMLGNLARCVGGRSVLMALDDEPLPDEPFEWAGVPEDIRPVVQEMLDTCDRCADELLDVEHRTAMRRFLSRAAVGDPAAFRRKAAPVRGAAAVAWVICRANESAGNYSQLTVKELMAWFGVKGSASQRADPLLRANGVEPRELYGDMGLGTPDLLTAARRRVLIDQRDRWLAESDG